MAATRYWTLSPPLRFIGARQRRFKTNGRKDGEVVGGLIGTRTHLVIGKDYVHAPVQTVLDAPMQANGLTQSFSVGRQAAEIETTFN